MGGTVEFSEGEQCVLMLVWGCRTAANASSHEPPESELKSLHLPEQDDEAFENAVAERLSYRRWNAIDMSSLMPFFIAPVSP